ncbi:MAG: 4-hydroxythreonine-4-phosphate dehydrogenase PdxA, partial [Paracoccaceae bacterium]
MNGKPLALTLGDPSGIGPEISVEAWKAVGRELPVLLVGDADHVRRTARRDGIEVVAVDHPSRACEICDSALPVWHVPLKTEAIPGRAEPANAASVIGFIETAVELTLKGQAAAIVTNPVSKQVLHAGASFAYPGHTEFLAALGGSKRGVMMLAAPGLRAVPATIHIPLADVPRVLTPQLLSETIRITAAALRSDFGVAAPRLAVA